jgi:Rrf2 family protein
MLRLSTKGEYGVRAMFEIAKSHPKPLTIKEISEKQNLSIPYLEQILNKLRKAALIESKKGPGGGYILNKNPEDISILEILKELEGPIALTSCLNPSEGCVRVNRCVTHLLWKALGQQISELLNTVTLKNLLALDYYGISQRKALNSKKAPNVLNKKYKV